MIIFLPSNVAFLDLSFIVISGIEISTISFLETVDFLSVLLIFFVLQGYDLHKIVLDYLESKVSLNDRSRISEIESAFRNYHYKLDSNFDFIASKVFYNW